MQFACVSAASSEWETVVVVFTSSVYLMRIMQCRTDRERRRRLCCTPLLSPFWTGVNSTPSRCCHGHVKPLFGTNPPGHFESDEGYRFTRKKNRERPISHITHMRTHGEVTHTHIRQTPYCQASIDSRIRQSHWSS